MYSRNSFSVLLWIFVIEVTVEQSLRTTKQKREKEYKGREREREREREKRGFCVQSEIANGYGWQKEIKALREKRRFPESTVCPTRNLSLSLSLCSPQHPGPANRQSSFSKGSCSFVKLSLASLSVFYTFATAPRVAENHLHFRHPIFARESTRHYLHFCVLVVGSVWKRWLR